MSRDDSLTTRHIAERNRNVVELQAQGRVEESLRAAEETELLAVIHLPDSDRERAKAICNLAAIQGMIGDNSKALETFARALSALRTAVGEQHEYYGRTLGTFAGFLKSLDRCEEAELHFVKAIVVLAAS